jgi:hypothetical protein
MRDTDATVAWYRSHETAAQLGYDPDGMCLKICREARGIGAVYPSAVSAQQATPVKYRVTNVADIERGMVVYYDDPRDSNPFGHIVTVVGRASGVARSSLSSLLVRTNSVKANEVVVVRGDYFPRFWGDEFQFAATWLNGQELIDFHRDEPTPTPEPKPKATRVRNAIEELQAAVRFHEKRGHDRIVRALRRDIRELRQTINDVL